MSESTLITILISFITVLAGSIGTCAVWFANTILIPIKDKHIEFINKMDECLTNIKLDILEIKSELKRKQDAGNSSHTTPPGTHHTS